MDEIQQLITECAANNRLSQEKLYRKFFPPLILLCRKFFPENEDAMEALNDGMLQVFIKINSYDPAKGNFFNWAYTIVRHAAIDKIRQRPAPVMEILEDGPYVMEENTLASLEWKDIYVLLNALPPGTRAVCTLYYLESFSIKDISLQLGQSPGTIKWHLSETRRKLKPILEQHYLKK